jgi:FAD/FMN-containing dehydrogenase
MRIQDELTPLVAGDIDVTPDTLARASHDASIFEVVPEVVVAPVNANDLRKLVEYASNHPGVNLTARSGGTDMSGGPLTNSIVVEFLKYFNQIRKVEEGYAITQPGVYYRDFDKATKAVGDQIMPSYPASREICTVGGMVANNSGGEKTLTYGKTERYVRRLKMVLADGSECEFKPLSSAELIQKKKQQNFEGEVYRRMYDLITKNDKLLQIARPVVSKNSCGYYLWNVWDKEHDIFDLTKMIVGSQGTLGLITEIEFALVKPKTHSRLLVIFLKDLKLLGETATAVLKFKPESFESYDDHTFKIAVKFLPQLMKQMGGSAISLGLHFIPEMLAVLEGGVPKLVLMAEFTADSDEEAVRMAMDAQESLKEFHEKSRVTKTAEDAHKYWVIRRESFNMLRHHVKELRTAPFIDDFAVQPALLPDFLPKLYSILDQYNLTYTIAGHVGDGNFHIIPLMNLHEQHSHDVIKELSVKVYALVHEFNGTITAEHNDGLIRTPFIKMQYGETVYKLFEEVKKVWDPKGIFNPGKKVGTTWEDAVQKIVK